MILGRLQGYFDQLLNEENPRSIFDDGVPNQGLKQGISRNEVKVAISRMKKGKATGMDRIPVEQCRISLYGRSGTCHGPRDLGAPRTWGK